MPRDSANVSERNTRQIAGATDPATLAQESRKLRNRLSQKAYRARQCMRIKELEERLDSRPQSENSRVLDLEKQNVFLRDQLLTCHKKLESMQVTLRAISDSTANAVGLETSADRCNSRKNSHASDRQTPDADEDHSHRAYDGEDSDDSAEPIATAITQAEQPEAQRMDMDQPYLNLMNTQSTTNNPLMNNANDQQLSLAAAHTNSDLFDLDQLLSASLPQFNGLTGSSNNNAFVSPLSQATLNFPFTHMGPAAYADLSEKGVLLVQGSHGQLRRTNSLFSDHITIVEYFLRQKWLNVGALMNHGDECLAHSVSFMLSAFVYMSWQMMTAWHTYTKAHVPLRKLITWHLNPTAESYMKISPNYRPTQIQLSVPHPSIIDWIPWPAMRDKLILCHSANPSLDDLICEIGNSYVAQGDLSKLVANVRPVVGYVGVWDLVRAISPETTTNINGPTQEAVFSGTFDADFSSDGGSPHGSLDNSDAGVDSAPQLPAPSVHVLFTSKTFALQAFKCLGMDQGAGTFKLDPAFFERHPELYDCKTSLIAHGIPLRSPIRVSVPSPRPLDTGLLGRYRELTTWTFDSAVDRAFGQDIPCAA